MKWDDRHSYSTFYWPLRWADRDEMGGWSCKWTDGWMDGQEMKHNLSKDIFASDKSRYTISSARWRRMNRGRVGEAASTMKGDTSAPHKLRFLKWKSACQCQTGWKKRSAVVCFDSFHWACTVRVLVFECGGANKAIQVKLTDWDEWNEDTLSLLFAPLFLFSSFIKLTKGSSKQTWWPGVAWKKFKHHILLSISRKRTHRFIFYSTLEQKGAEGERTKNMCIY